MGSERAREQIGQGEKVPENELARVLLADSFLGVNWPGSKKAVKHISHGVQVGINHTPAMQCTGHIVNHALAPCSQN